MGGDRDRGRYHWLGQLRDWLLDNTERIADTMQARPARSAATPPTAGYLADLINFYGTKAAKFIGDESSPAPLAAAGREEADIHTGPTPWSA